MNILFCQTHNIFDRSKKVNKIVFLSERRKLPKNAHFGSTPGGALPSSELQYTLGEAYKAKLWRFLALVT